MARAQTAEWKKHVDSSHGFSIEYPANTRPEGPHGSEPGLLVAFPFEQTIKYQEDSANMKFRFTVSRSRNPGNLSASDWANREVRPEFRLDFRTIALARREGAQVRTHDLNWPQFRNFLVDGEWMYELQYPDMATPQILSPETRAYWSKLIDRMLASFEFTAEKGTVEKK